MKGGTFYYMARFGDGVDIYLHKSDKPCYFASRVGGEVEFLNFDDWCNQQTATEWTVLTRITKKFYGYMNNKVGGSYGRETNMVRMNMYFNSGVSEPAILNNPPRKARAGYYLVHSVEHDDLIYVRQSSRKYAYAMLSVEHGVSVVFTNLPTTVPLYPITKEILAELQSVPLDARLSQLAILASHNLL